MRPLARIAGLLGIWWEARSLEVAPPHTWGILCQSHNHQYKPSKSPFTLYVSLQQVPMEHDLCEKSICPPYLCWAEIDLLLALVDFCAFGSVVDIVQWLL